MRREILHEVYGEETGQRDGTGGLVSEHHNTVVLQ